jgi:hypothetical protein
VTDSLPLLYEDEQTWWCGGSDFKRLLAVSKDDKASPSLLENWELCLQPCLISSSMVTMTMCACIAMNNYSRKQLLGAYRRFYCYNLH